MRGTRPQGVVDLPRGQNVWDAVFTVAPLVIIGTREENGEYDLAAKHMATAVGWEGRFAFVCTPEHNTYTNARREGAFTVSYPLPSQVVLTTLTATPRCDGTEDKPVVRAVPTFPASSVDGELVSDAYLFLECEIERVIDGLGDASIIVGRIVAAQARSEALRSHDRDDQQVLAELPLLAYLPPGRYAEIAVSNAFPFPEGLEH